MGNRNQQQRKLEIDINVTINQADTAAVSLHAHYTSNDSTKEEIMSILRNIFEGSIGGKIDPEILNISKGSLRMILRCYSQQSFLQFLHDYETGRAKERLNKEFSKIGIGNVILEIANAEEIKEKKKNLGR